MYNSEKAEFSNFTYADKDFASIYPDLLDLAKNLTKKWDPSISNESDPGVVLLKEGAFLADHINYNTDKNILEGFLPTATQESSVRNLVQMGGYLPNYYVSAEGEVSFYFDYKAEQEGEEESTTEFGGFTIPSFTLNITDSEGEHSFVQKTKLIIDKNGKGTCKFVEGFVNDLEINGEKTITIENLDDDNRLYLPVNNIAQNGVFIRNIPGNSDQDWGDNLWVREEYLNVLPGHTKCYKIEFDSDKNSVYIEFPSDVAELFENGIQLKYIITEGSSGNIPANYLTTISSPTEFTVLIGTTETTHSMENFTIKNSSSFENGKDPETIEEMYHNFKEVVGTFDTLVTCRDYSNFIRQLEKEETPGVRVVSNAVASDCTNDYNSAVNAVTYDSFGKFVKAGVSEPKVNFYTGNPTEIPAQVGDVYCTIDGNNKRTLSWKKSEDETVIITDFHKFLHDIEGMGSGDVKLCALLPFSISKYNFDDPAYAMERSFEPVKNKVNESENPGLVSIEKIKESLEEYKCISTSFEDKTTGTFSDGGDLFYFRVKTPLSIQVITYEKINSKEIFEGIKHNIYVALSNAFNSSQLEFGEMLNRDELYQTILDSDERIKNVYITEGSPNTVGVYVNEESDDYLDPVSLSVPAVTSENNSSVDLLVDLISKNILAGRLCLFNFITDLDFNYGQKDVSVFDDVLTIKTETKITPRSAYNKDYFGSIADLIELTEPPESSTGIGLVENNVGALNILLEGNKNRLKSLFEHIGKITNSDKSVIELSKDDELYYYSIWKDLEYNQLFIKGSTEKIIQTSLDEDGNELLSLDDYIIRYNYSKTILALIYTPIDPDSQVKPKIIPLSGSINGKSAIAAAIDLLNKDGINGGIDFNKGVYLVFLHIEGVYNPEIDYTEIIHLPKYGSDGFWPIGNSIDISLYGEYELNQIYKLSYSPTLDIDSSYPSEAEDVVVSRKYNQTLTYTYSIPEKVENHYIYIARPNFVDDQIYPTYCYYRFYPLDPTDSTEYTIKAGEDTLLNNCQLDIWYKKDNAGQIVHLKPGTVINSTFDISTDDFVYADEDSYSSVLFTKTWSETNLTTNVNQTFSEKFKMIPSTGTISTKSLLETKLDSKINCYWIKNNNSSLFNYTVNYAQQSSLTCSGDTFISEIIGAEDSLTGNGKERVCTILNDNEYFIYTNSDKSSFAIFGPGTMLSIPLESAKRLLSKYNEENRTKSENKSLWQLKGNITIDNIYKNGFNSDLDWVEINFKDDPLYITEMNLSVLSSGDSLIVTKETKNYNESYDDKDLAGFEITTTWSPIKDLESVTYTSTDNSGDNIISLVDSYFFRTEFILPDNKVELKNYYIKDNFIGDLETVEDLNTFIKFKYEKEEDNKIYTLYDFYTRDNNKFLMWSYYPDLTYYGLGNHKFYYPWTDGTDSSQNPYQWDVNKWIEEGNPYHESDGYKYVSGYMLTLDNKIFAVPESYIIGNQIKPLVGNDDWGAPREWIMDDLDELPRGFTEITENIIITKGDGDVPEEISLPLGSIITSNFNFGGVNSSIVNLTEDKKVLLLEDITSSYKIMSYHKSPWEGSYGYLDSSKKYIPTVDYVDYILPDYGNLVNNYDLSYFSFNTILYNGQELDELDRYKEIDSSIGKVAKFKVPFYYYNPHELKYFSDDSETDLIVPDNYQYIIPIILTEPEGEELDLTLEIQTDNNIKIPLSEFGKENYVEAVKLKQDKTLYLITFNTEELKSSNSADGSNIIGKSSNLSLIFTWNIKANNNVRVTLQPIKVFYGINKNLELNYSNNSISTLSRVVSRMNEIVDNSSISGADIYYINEPENDMAIEDIKIIDENGNFNPQFLLDKNNIANRITLDSVEITNDSNEIYLTKSMRGYRE